MVGDKDRMLLISQADGVLANHRDEIEQLHRDSWGRDACRLRSRNCESNSPKVLSPASPFSQLPTAQNAITAERTILGTLQYMAPEQVEGREVDARTDIFAFGTVSMCSQRRDQPEGDRLV